MTVRASKAGSKAGGDDDIYTIDDKDFEKRYSGKLGKSGDGGVNIASVKGSVENKKPVAAGNKGAPAKETPALLKAKSIDKYEKDLNKSDIHNINN